MENKKQKLEEYKKEIDAMEYVDDSNVAQIRAMNIIKDVQSMFPSDMDIRAWERILYSYNVKDTNEKRKSVLNEFIEVASLGLLTLSKRLK